MRFQIDNKQYQNNFKALSLRHPKQTNQKNKKKNYDFKSKPKNTILWVFLVFFLMNFRPALLKLYFYFKLDIHPPIMMQLK